MLHRDAQNNVRWAWIDRRTGAVLDETLSVSEDGATKLANQMMPRSRAAARGDVRAVRISVEVLTVDAEEALRQQYAEVSSSFKARCAEQRGRRPRGTRAGA